MKSICLRLSPGRLLAGVAAALCLCLGVDAARTAAREPEAVLATAFEAARWLKDRGLEVDPAPVGEKTVFLSDTPGEAEAAYRAVLEVQGFTPAAHVGRALTLTCFRATAGEGVYARVLTDGGVLVGADTYTAAPEAAPFAPLAEGENTPR